MAWRSSKTPDPRTTGSITGTTNQDAGEFVYRRLGEGLGPDAARLGERFGSSKNPRIGGAKA
jgi:hypothetical protein